MTSKSETRTSATIGAAQRRIVDILKKEPGCAAASLSATLGVTTAAIRLQLNELEEMGLVRQTSTAGADSGRGRPSAVWSLTDKAIDLFPDRHSDLTVELIQSIRDALGNDALTQVLEKRDKHQLAQLLDATPANAGFNQKVKTLARVRSRMGYMAEVKKDGKSLVLTEHHCPVCAAARECQGLCRNELKLFQDYMGQGTSVKRIKHLIRGDERCVYEIKLVAAGS